MNMLRRGVVGVALTLGIVAGASPAGVGAPASAAHHSKAFVMPSRNIACLYDSGKIRCDIYSGLKPEPKKACKYFWKGVELDGKGKASFLCIIDTIQVPNAPVLHHGQTWSRGSIVCTSSVRGLRCHNDSGHGFFLSREKSRKW